MGGETQARVAGSLGERLGECDGVVLVALGGQWLVEAHVSRGQVELFGLRLLVAGSQIDAPVAAGGDRGFEFDQQSLREPAPAVAAVGPDALELRGLVIEPSERAAGDGPAVAQTDQ